MASIYRRGNRYYCWVKNEKGVWVRKSTGRADRDAARVERKRLDRMYADPAHYAANTKTIADAIEWLLDDRRIEGKARATLRMYEQKAAHFARVFGERTRLATLTGEMVRAYIKQRLEETASRHTIHKELVTMKLMLKVARSNGAFPADIQALFPAKFAPQYVPRRRFLSIEQVEKLLAELPPQRAAHVSYVIATGARRSEAYAARRGHLTGAFVHLLGTESPGADRLIPILEGTAFHKYLQRALEDGGKGKLLFKEWTNDRRDILAACARAGVPGVTWNDLRRTFGSWLRQAGVPLEDIAKMMGHTSTAMVERVYGQDTPEAMKNRVKASLHAPNKYDTEATGNSLNCT